tara:strand:- start:1848 stop:2438 length:591 start_codon:yes stop_codon:yes gene_type:complete
MATFAIAIFLMIITPGPGVLSLAGTGAGFGWRPGIFYLLGLFIGTNSVMILVITGLKGVLFKIPFVEPVFLIVSLSYLTWIAWRIAFSDNKTTITSIKKEPTFFEAIFLQLINPKAYLVNGILFAGFPIENLNLNEEIIAKVIIINLVWIPVHFFWLWLGIRLRSWGLESGKQKKVNKFMGFSLFVVVILAGISSI